MKKSKVHSSKSKVVWQDKSANPEYKPKIEDQRPRTELAKNIIFGVLPVLEALRAENRRIEKIIIAEGVRETRIAEIMFLARNNGVSFQKVPRENLSRLVENGANHQGVIAFVAAADYYPADKLLSEIYRKIEAGEKPLIVILDGVEDPRNFGAILRTIECAGADGVFIPERRAVGRREHDAPSGNEFGRRNDDVTEE